MSFEFIENGSPTSAAGFLAAGVTAGFKRSGAPDFAMIYSEKPADFAGVFTRVGVDRIFVGVLAGVGVDRIFIGVGITFSIARGGNHISGYLLAKNQPSILGVVDKYITVALYRFDYVVSAHFPLVNRVEFAPLKKYIHALENLGYTVSAPSGAPSYI